MSKLPLLAFFALLGSSQLGDRPTYVDAIERNTFVHMTDEGEQDNYTQIIFWEWLPDYSRYAAITWVLQENGSPSIERIGPWTEVQFTDSSKRRRMIRSRIYRETRTSHDPERQDTKLTSPRYRIKL